MPEGGLYAEMKEIKPEEKPTYEELYIYNDSFKDNKPKFIKVGPCYQVAEMENLIDRALYDQDDYGRSSSIEVWDPTRLSSSQVGR